MWCVSLIRTILPPFFLQKVSFPLAAISATKILGACQVVEGRTTCATTIPNVNSDMREMMPSEITQ